MTIYKLEKRQNWSNCKIYPCTEPWLFQYMVREAAKSYVFSGPATKGGGLATKKKELCEDLCGQATEKRTFIYCGSPKEQRVHSFNLKTPCSA